MKGPDGKTARQRVRGLNAIARVIPFGEVRRYKARSQEAGIAGTIWKWSMGIWMGIQRRTGQYIVYDKARGGIRAARTILRMPEPQQWSLEIVKDVSATPWSVHEPSTPEVIHHQPADKPQAAEKLAHVRRVYQAS